MLAEDAQIGLAAKDANNYIKFFSKAVYLFTNPFISKKKKISN